MRTRQPHPLSKLSLSTNILYSLRQQQHDPTVTFLIDNNDNNNNRTGTLGLHCHPHPLLPLPGAILNELTLNECADNGPDSRADNRD